VVCAVNASHVRFRLPWFDSVEEVESNARANCADYRSDSCNIILKNKLRRPTSHRVPNNIGRRLKSCRQIGTFAQKRLQSIAQSPAEPEA
jgi:hypothetical protein